MKRTALYLLPFFAKSMTVYYFILLAPLLANQVISPAAVGYIGALSIGALVMGALLVMGWLHRQSSRAIVQAGAWIALASSIILYAGISTHNVFLITLSFITSGFEVGLSMAGANAIVAAKTNRGNRYQILGRMSMLGDISRIVFPILVAGAIGLGGLPLAVWLIGLMAALFVLVAQVAPDADTLPTTNTPKQWPPLRRNASFRFFLSLEFLDSFASSQLFVFVPILFLAKGYSLQNSLLLQSAIFLGYLSGRWFVTELAHRLGGVRAVVLAEVGMGATIGMLLISSNLMALYALTWLLGVFARGTSPVIKALVFDSLRDGQMKRGSAIHVIAGDSGSAIGQLVFGLAFAWLGIYAPFLAAAVLTLGVAALVSGYANLEK